MGRAERYRERIAERLRSTLDSHGSSVQAIEKRLRRGRGYVGDALRGEKRLSVEMILEVLGVLGVAPEEFFERPAPDPRAGEVAELDLEQRYAALPSSVREASALVQALLLALEQRGLLTLEQVLDVQRRLATSRDSR
jgi:transcriptional regulator with XRE-family HTH domain